MKFDYTIKNFRAFDSTGATFTISPITILTGTNSSGKSSMTKSLLLMNHFLSALKEASQKGVSNPMNIPLDFSNKEAMLGSYGKCLNFDSSDCDPITISYRVHSLYLSQDCTVTWVFSPIDHRTGQKDGNGWVSSLSILSDNGAFELSIDYSKGKQRIIKYSRLGAKEAFFRTYKGLSLIDMYSTVGNSSADGQGVSIEDRGPHNRSFIIPESMETMMSQEQFNDAYKIYLKMIQEQDFHNYNSAKFVSSFDDFFQLPILDNLRHLSAEELFAELRGRFSSDELRGALDVLKKDFIAVSAEDLDDYLHIKTRFWLTEGFFPADYPIMGDFFSTLKNLMHINVYDSPLNRISDEDRTPLPFPVVINILFHAFKSEESKNLLRLLDTFEGFCFNVIKEIMFPPFVGNMNYISSSRAVVRRVFTKNDKGNSLDILLQQYDEGRKMAAATNGFKSGLFIDLWLKKFGVGDSLIIEPDGHGVGIIPFISKNGRKLPLADLGYGVTQLFSILLNIETAILFAELDGILNLRPFYIVIEEPEIHLHPRLQSLLADLFVEAYLACNIHFIVETHSEYLIRKYQYLVASHAMNKDFCIESSTIGIYYLYDADPNNRPKGQSHVQAITILPNGFLDNPFGEGFSDISTDLILELHQISKNDVK